MKLYLKVEFHNLITDGKKNIYMNHSCIGDVGNGVRTHECDSLLV